MINNICTRDPNAFIFSVSEQKVFKVKDNKDSEAIQATQNTIFAFGTDFHISNDCDKNKDSFSCFGDGIYEFSVDF